MHLYLHAQLILVQENNIYHNNRYYKVSYQGSLPTSYEHQYEQFYIVDANNVQVNHLPDSQLLDEAGNSYIVPRKKGCIVLFDSRTQHRVLKVTKGIRKSIVGWTVGPRWKQEVYHGRTND